MLTAPPTFTSARDPTKLKHTYRSSKHSRTCQPPVPMRFAYSGIAMGGNLKLTCSPDHRLYWDMGLAPRLEGCEVREPSRFELLCRLVDVVSEGSCGVAVAADGDCVETRLMCGEEELLDWVEAASPGSEPSLCSPRSRPHYAPLTQGSL